MINVPLTTEAYNARLMVPALEASAANRSLATGAVKAAFARVTGFRQEDLRLNWTGADMVISQENWDVASIQICSEVGVSIPSMSASLTLQGVINYVTTRLESKSEEARMPKPVGMKLIKPPYAVELRPESPLFATVYGVGNPANTFTAAISAPFGTSTEEFAGTAKTLAASPLLASALFGLVALHEGASPEQKKVLEENARMALRVAGWA